MSAPAAAANILHPSRTALLFFDMLNGHVKKDDAALGRYRPVIAAAVELLAAARAYEMMVAYACANHRPDNATSAHIIRDSDNRLRPLSVEELESGGPLIAAGTWEAQIIDELAPRALDYLIPKYRWSAFHQTCLDLALRTRGVDTILISGGSTDVGVASTAYAARDMDYNTVIVSDACTSPERDNHEQMMRRIFPRMARVRTARQVIEMLARGAR
jgi:ureidoacrylate peracid hydrolase